MHVLMVNIILLEDDDDDDDDDDSTNIEDVHICNVESHVIIRYNEGEGDDED